MSTALIKPEEHNSPLVFISHAHQDSKPVRRIKDWLETTGCACWIFQEKCDDKYRKEIDEAIIKCDIFLLMGSRFSYTSEEVARELSAADALKKHITHYKLDKDNHLSYPGFLTILANKQFIQMNNPKSPSELILAKAIFKAWDKNPTNESAADRHRQLSELYENEIQKLNRWRDRLWTLKLDGKGRARKNLSNSDKELLKAYAKDLKLYLSIEDEEVLYRPKKGEFYQELRSIVAKLKIDKRMLAQVERKRLECCISRNVAAQTLEKILTQNSYLEKLSLSKKASLETTHWLVKAVVNIKRRHKSNDDQYEAAKLNKTSGKSNQGNVDLGSASVDSSPIEESSGIILVSGSDDQQKESTFEHLSDNQVYRQDSLDELVDTGQSSNNPGILNADNTVKATTNHNRNVEYQSPSASHLYSLNDLPSTLLRPVSILTQAITDSHTAFTNLLTASNTTKRDVATKFNIHIGNADKLIMLICFLDERGFERLLLVSTNYLSISGYRPNVYPYHFPLVISNPGRRIVMTLQNDCKAITFSYSPRLGILEKCSHVNPAEKLFTKDSSKLFKWLLILLESASPNFSDATNLTSSDLLFSIKAIQLGDFQRLRKDWGDNFAHTSSMASQNLPNKQSSHFTALKANANSWKADNQKVISASAPLISDSGVHKQELTDSSTNQDIQSFYPQIAMYWPWPYNTCRDPWPSQHIRGEQERLVIISSCQVVQKSYISALSKLDISGSLFRMFNSFSKPIRLQYGEKIIGDPILQRLLTSHQLKEISGFKPLLYYNAGSFRVKRGFILFDKGISLLTFFSGPHLFLFGLSEIDEFCEVTVENRDLRIILSGPSLAGAEIKKFDILKECYNYGYSDDIYDADLFASSLRRIITKLNNQRLTYSRLKESICQEARQLLYYKNAILRKKISLFTSSKPDSASSLGVDTLRMLKATNLTVPHYLDTILSIQSIGTEFTSVILIALEGAYMLASEKGLTSGKFFKWSSIRSFIYRDWVSFGNSTFAISSASENFIVPWENFIDSRDHCRELAAFIFSLSKRFCD